MFMTLEKLEMLVAEKRANNKAQRKFRNELRRKIDLLRMLNEQTQDEAQLTQMNKGLYADMKEMESAAFGQNLGITPEFPDNLGEELDDWETNPEPTGGFHSTLMGNIGLR